VWKNINLVAKVAKVKHGKKELLMEFKDFVARSAAGFLAIARRSIPK